MPDSDPFEVHTLSTEEMSALMPPRGQVKRGLAKLGLEGVNFDIEPLPPPSAEHENGTEGDL